MNKRQQQTIMLETIYCIRFGDILLDENRQIFLLCTNCHTDYRDLQQFRKHLDKCSGLEHLFQRDKLAFKPNKGTQIIGKSCNDDESNKKYLLYDIKEMETIASKTRVRKTITDENSMDMLKIEEELSDPRWYTNPTAPQNNVASMNTATHTKMPYNELVAEMTPFVHFNVECTKSNEEKSENSRRSSKRLSQQYLLNNKDTLAVNQKSPKRHVSTLAKEDSVSCIEIQLSKTAINKNPEVFLHNIPIGSKLKSSHETIPTVMIPNCNISGLLDDPQVLHASSKSSSNHKNNTTIAKQSLESLIKHPQPSLMSPLVLNRNSDKSNNYAISSKNNSNNKTIETEQILNKLHTLGLKVTRHTKESPIVASNILNDKAHQNDKTLELIKKLQSKGMRVKRVHNDICKNGASGTNTATEKLSNKTAVSPKSTRVEKRRKLSEDIYIVEPL